MLVRSPISFVFLVLGAIFASGGCRTMNWFGGEQTDSRSVGELLESTEAAKKAATQAPAKTGGASPTTSTVERSQPAAAATSATPTSSQPAGSAPATDAPATDASTPPTSQTSGPTPAAAPVAPNSAPTTPPDTEANSPSSAPPPASDSSSNESVSNNDSSPATASMASGETEQLVSTVAAMEISPSDPDAAFQVWLDALESEARDDSRDIRERRYAELRWRLAMLLSNLETPESLEPIVEPSVRDSPDPRHEAVLVQLRTLRLLLGESRVAGDRWSETAAAMRAAVDAIVPLCPLELRNVDFCRAVHSYGVIEPFAERSFRPRQEVLLYVELENFEAHATPDGFETELQAAYRIVDGQQRRIAEQPLPLDKQTSRNRRRDYFIAYRLFLPADIAPGSYTLQLTLDDLKGRKSAASSIDFTTP